jgi:hypothetical protein
MMPEEYVLILRWIGYMGPPGLVAVIWCLVGSRWRGVLKFWLGMWRRWLRDQLVAIEAGMMTVKASNAFGEGFV